MLTLTTPANDARAIANYLLAKAEVDQVSLDHLKLQKLVYIAHGWHLGLFGTPLIRQLIEAWTYGPVVGVIYQAFKPFGANPIDSQAHFYDSEMGAWKDYEPTLTPNSKAVLDQVWEKYRGFSGTQLITLTHQPGTPWHATVGNLPPEQRRNVPIPNDLIKEYYATLAAKNKANLSVPSA
jgi:uncharacterized phage-associated protein